MDAKEYEVMFGAEERHWWYSGMQRITTTLLAQYYPPGSNLQILDAGCGTGAAMRYLSPFGAVTGCDLAALALQFCRQRSLERLSQATVVSLPFREQEFDLVTSLDVLYHQAVLDRDRAMLEFNRVLRPEGRLFLRLPAYDWLRRSHDRAVHTAHRFTAGEVREALRAAGFAVEKLSYANTLLFPLALVERILEITLSLEPDRSDLQSSSFWSSRFLAKVLYAEAGWLRGHSLPWGLSVIAVGRKEFRTGDSVGSG